jgi:hypothetical protein
VNNDPYKARIGKRRRGKPGNLLDVQRELWHALQKALEVLDEALEPELILKGVHAVSQVSGQYAKLLEIGELEARVQSLEAQVVMGGHHAL